MTAPTTGGTPIPISITLNAASRGASALSNGRPRARTELAVRLVGRPGSTGSPRIDPYDGIGGGFGSMVRMALRWEEGRLAEEPPCAGFEELVWAAAQAAARGEAGTGGRPGRPALCMAREVAERSDGRAWIKRCDAVAATLP